MTLTDDRDATDAALFLERATADALKSSPVWTPLPPLSAYYTPDPVVTGTTRSATTPAELTALCDPNTSHPGDGILISGMLKGFFTVPPGVIVQPVHAHITGGDGILGGLTMLANSAMLDLNGTQAADQASPTRVFCTINQPGVVVRRCVVHDIYDSAFVVMGARYAEISECIGYNALTKGYFIYTHNDLDAAPRTVDVFRNVMWNFSEGYGLHFYSAGPNFVKNYRAVQNISVGLQANIGGTQRPTSNFLFQANHILKGNILRVGWLSAHNHDVRMIDNVISANNVSYNGWQAVEHRGNVYHQTTVTSDYPLPLGSPFTDKLPDMTVIPLAGSYNIAWVIVPYSDGTPNTGASKAFDPNSLPLVAGTQYKLINVQDGTQKVKFTFSPGMAPLNLTITTAPQVLALRTT